MTTRFAIATLGCKVNQYDSAIIESRLRARGMERRDFSERFGLQIQLAQLMVEVILEKQVVDAPVLTHGIEIKLGERGEPVRVKLFHPNLSSR